MSNSLKYTAERLGLKHRELMRLMREKGLLDAHNLPANPVLTKEFLVTRENRYHHPEHGLQYPRTTRVTEAIVQVSATSEETSASAEEVSASTEELSAQSEELAATANQMKDLAEALSKATSRFKLA